MIDIFRNKKLILPTYFAACIIVLSEFYRSIFYIISWGDVHTLLWFSITVVGLLSSCLLVVKDNIFFHWFARQSIYLVTFIVSLKLSYIIFAYFVFGVNLSVYSMISPLLAMIVSYLVLSLVYGFEVCKTHFGISFPISLLIAYQLVEYVRIASG